MCYSVNAPIICYASHLRYSLDCPKVIITSGTWKVVKTRMIWRETKACSQKESSITCLRVCDGIKSTSERLAIALLCSSLFCSMSENQEVTGLRWFKVSTHLVEMVLYCLHLKQWGRANRLHSTTKEGLKCFVPYYCKALSGKAQLSAYRG